MQVIEKEIVPFFVDFRKAAICINCDSIYDGERMITCPKCTSGIRKFLIDFLGELNGRK